MASIHHGPQGIQSRLPVPQSYMIDLIQRVMGLWEEVHRYNGARIMNLCGRAQGHLCRRMGRSPSVSPGMMRGRLGTNSS